MQENSQCERGTHCLAHGKNLIPFLSLPFYLFSENKNKILLKDTRQSKSGHIYSEALL